jgi:hypothetical protein
MQPCILNTLHLDYQQLPETLLVLWQNTDPERSTTELNLPLQNHMSQQNSLSRKIKNMPDAHSLL